LSQSNINRPVGYGINARIRFVSKESMDKKGIRSYSQWRFRNPRMDNEEMYAMPLEHVRAVQPPELIITLTP